MDKDAGHEYAFQLVLPQYPFAFFSELWPSYGSY